MHSCGRERERAEFSAETQRTRKNTCVFSVLPVSLWLALALSVSSSALAQGNADQLYKEAVTREAALRTEIDTRKAGTPALPLLRRARILMSTYEDMARLFPKSAYSDNALWQGGMLAADAFFEFGEAGDRTTALRMLNGLITRFPTSTLIKQAQPQVTRLSAAVPARAAAVAQASAPTSALSTLKAIRREVMGDALRVTLELEKEVSFHDERLDGPSRVFIDLQNTTTVDALKDATLAYQDDVVRQIRLGRQLGMRTRVVLDLEGAGRHSVYALYNPFRIVVDIERPGAAKATKDLLAAKDTKTTPTTKDAKVTKEEPAPAPAPKVIEPTVARAVEPIAPPIEPVRITEAPPTPTAPRRNTDGSLSLSRQLGLGISRIVIDAGHGGHDPGAKVRGLTEAELVLDIALRLEKLLLAQPGVEVVLTRRKDEFIALEERTAIANREEADLFLSIHANASEDARARGFETYFLNFAPNPQAEAVAARENAASVRTMHSLPGMVKAITLNNKIDESKDFASAVQASMVDRMKRANRATRSLGVKQAPFVVLIGAAMPSVLAEVSFLTHRQEQTWLKTPAYRQQLAEALFNGVMRYQRSLKGAQVATNTR